MVKVSTIGMFLLFLQKDIETIESLGVDAYRFSISWARVLPRGRFGEVNQNGIMFYNKILDNLLVRGIKPFVTIHHDDFPQELQDRYGSWLSPLMQEDYVHFAETCFKNFGDRVKHWITINEPNLVAQMGYQNGKYPPGRCSQPFGNCSAGNSDIEPLIVMHNLLLAHGKAVKLYRIDYQREQKGLVGIVLNCLMYEPLTDDDLDQEASARALAFDIGWVLDPLIFGDYPSEMRKYLGNQLPRFSITEKNFIKDGIDFIGVNHYTTQYAKDCIYSSCSLTGNRAIKGFVDATSERDGIRIGESTGIEIMRVVPRGIGEMIDYLKIRYNNKPMFVTENGYSEPGVQDQVEIILQDDKRVEFHNMYMSSLAQAIRDGADVRGYFVWTLIDAFEWFHGYAPRFGLYYVDRKTLTRIPKLSARWYQNFLKNNTQALGIQVADT
uniref:beta-glucosidase 18-like isoform X2 n=1 Tax=Erigeron canadensis TaxID=72917 RepID=UPI001CB94DC6|nr:beta-glucosidase 18-like isoform X2 [Erigeron canadensis]